MSSFLWTLLLPFALGKTVRIDITKDTPGTRWSPGWSTIAGSQYFGGTLASARDADETLIFEFAGTSVSVYGTGSPGNQANSSYALDGSMPRLYQGLMTVVSSNIPLYISPRLEDMQHTLVIRNLASGGLSLDYFEVTASTPRDGELISTSSLSSRSIGPRDEPLQPAVIAGLTVASVAVLLGFIILFILWRREYRRKPRKEPEADPGTRLLSQDDAQRDSRPPVPFPNDGAHIEPFISTPLSLQPSQSSQVSRATTPAVTTATPVHPRSSREQVADLASSSHRDEKRLLPVAQAHTMESISRLNLQLDVDPRNHSVVGQPSNYESEASVDPLHRWGRENDAGVSLLGSSETVNPKALRLPPDYRRFSP